MIFTHWHPVGDLIQMWDVIDRLTPKGLEKMKEWMHMNKLRMEYIASVKAEVAQDERDE